ncbi:MAG: hypothetical protein WKF50_05295 [Nocardioides sp.]
MQLLLVLVSFTDQLPKGPEPEDVKAGWTALAIFLLLGVALAFLMFSMVKQLRKAQAAKDSGVYGEPDEAAAQAEQQHGSRDD